MARYLTLYPTLLLESKKKPWYFVEDLDNLIKLSIILKSNLIKLYSNEIVDDGLIRKPGMLLNEEVWEDPSSTHKIWNKWIVQVV